MLEAAAFNGDEPTGPYAWPLARRFGDSWALRATAHVAPGVELQASVADVTSPEHRTGGGLDQRKTSLSARLAREGAAGGAYALLEAARTDDRNGGRRAFRYESLLGEGALRRGPWTAALRLERTTRPEEDRLLDPFRAPRPHGELSIIGLTRWSVATLALSRAMDAPRGLVLRPLAEVGWAHATPRVRPALFEPRGFYGAAAQWSLSVGLRASLGALHSRMGRYGVAAPHPAGDAAHAGAAGHDGGHPPPPNAPAVPGYFPPR
jgi:hypothetical protein